MYLYISRWQVQKPSPVFLKVSASVGEERRMVLEDEVEGG